MPSTGCGSTWKETGLSTPAEPPAATGYDVLRNAAASACEFNPEPSCPEEWPDKEEMWCGSCLAREVLKVVEADGK